MKQIRFTEVQINWVLREQLSACARNLRLNPRRLLKNKAGRDSP